MTAAIGAHVSVAGGLLKALPRAEAIGAEMLQIFVANPRGWALPPADPAGDEEFRAITAERGIPVFIHAPYLINFGSPSAATLEKSAEALAFSLRRGAAIGAKGVIMHAGSSVLNLTWDEATLQVRERVLPLLDAVGAAPELLVEPTAGGGGALASTAESLHDFLDVLDRDERIGVCIDTCHMHAAGTDMSTPASFAAALRSYAKAAGKPGIRAVHVNDSRDPVASKRDRHEALGKGTIGPTPFAELFKSPATRRLPLIVETAEADIPTDIATLKALRNR
ncbi:MAG TPA: deoxyribonuclease IV [Jatrophihabitans sp.]|jgi:deoxyribonuclease-4